MALVFILSLNSADFSLMLLRVLCIVSLFFTPLTGTHTSSAYVKYMEMSALLGSWRYAIFSIKMLNRKGLRIPPWGIPFPGSLRNDIVP